MQATVVAPEGGSCVLLTTARAALPVAGNLLHSSMLVGGILVVWVSEQHMPVGVAMIVLYCIILLVRCCPEVTAYACCACAACV